MRDKINFKKYFLIFILSAIFFLIGATINNAFWIDDSPEWNSEHTVENMLGKWKGPVSEYSDEEFLDYFIRYRIASVLGSFNDLMSALLCGIFVSFIVFIVNMVYEKRIFKKNLFRGKNG